MLKQCQIFLNKLCFQLKQISFFLFQLVDLTKKERYNYEKFCTCGTNVTREAAQLIKSRLFAKKQTCFLELLMFHKETHTLCFIYPVLQKKYLFNRHCKSKLSVFLFCFTNSRFFYISISLS